VARDEEGCGSVRISMFNLSEGEGGALEARWEPTTLRNTSAEMGQHHHGFCNPFATDF